MNTCTKYAAEKGEIKANPLICLERAKQRISLKLSLKFLFRFLFHIICSELFVNVGLVNQIQSNAVVNMKIFTQIIYLVEWEEERPCPYTGQTLLPSMETIFFCCCCSAPSKEDDLPKKQ